MNQSLKAIIALTYAYYNPGRVCDDFLVEAYAEDLSDLEPGKCVSAYYAWRKNPKNRNFPLPAQIRELVCPQDYIGPDALAQEIAARIVGAVPKFGWPNPQGARTYIGEEGWAVVTRMGGWQYLCENMGRNIKPSIFQAQVRDMLESNIKYGPALQERIENPISLGARKSDVMQIMGKLTEEKSLESPEPEPPEAA